MEVRVRFHARTVPGSLILMLASALATPRAHTPQPASVVTGVRALGSPAPSQAAAVQGTGVIIGQVVDAGGGSPIAGAIVTLQGRSPGPLPPAPGRGGPPPSLPPAGALTATAGRAAVAAGPQRAMTDPQGRFVFQQLPKGAYSFSVSLAGYVGGGYEQRNPTGGSSQLTLETDEKLAGIVLRMWKLAAVEGSVTDETGDPLVGIEVLAVRRTIVGGRPSYVPGRTAQTDDRGRYRLSSLLPGEYLVLVPASMATVPTSVNDAYLQASTGGVTPELMREISSYGVLPSIGSSGVLVGDMLIPSTGTNARNLLIPPPQQGPVFEYQTLFYPSTTSASEASVLPLASGEERTGCDLQLRPVATFSVSGTISGPDGPMARAGLRLLPGFAASLAMDNGFETATTISDAAGSFTFLGVPPGSYTLKVTRMPRVQPLVSRVVTSDGTGRTTVQITSQAVTAQPTEPVLWAEQAVSVGNADVNGIALMLREGLRVSGRVQFSGAAPLPTPQALARVSVSLTPVDGRLPNSPAAVHVTANGEFTTGQYPPGRYLIGAGPPGVPWHLASATIGGRDVSSSALQLDEDVSGVLLSFTDRQTSIAGTVRNPSGATDTTATVVIFPSDYRQWIEAGMSNRRTRIDRASTTGAFSNPQPAGGRLPDRGRLGGCDRRRARPPVLRGTRPLRHTRDAGRRRAADDGPAGGDHPMTRARPAAAILMVGWTATFAIGWNATMAARQARDPTSQPTIGTSALSGTVVSTDAAATPIRRAQVMVSGGQLRPARVAVTDDQGRFELAGLPAGRVSVRVTKPAYLTSYYGARRPWQGPGQSVALTEGAREAIAIPLARGAVLAGKTRDPTGRPAVGARVLAMQYPIERWTPHSDHRRTVRPDG